MSQESSHRFLERTPFCNPKDQRVVERAHEITRNKSGREAARALFLWVRENIEYKIIGIESASATLRRKQGCCLAKSNVMVAMARAIEIPARYVLFEGRLLSPREDIAGQRLAHIVPEVFIEDEWVIGDPAYERNLASVYETGELGKVSWCDVQKEERHARLPIWLWPGQRLMIWLTPGAWKVRNAVAAARKGS